MINADSIKARLKQYAQNTGHTFQEALTYYVLERTIYRICKSKYSNHFVLKGGIFLYAVFNRDYERVTTDIDFLAKRISNSSSEMKAVFKDILSQNVDDAVIFDTESIRVEEITEFKEYHGIRVSVIGYLEKTRISVGIDIGFGDVIYPKAVKMEFPVLLDMDPPEINVYSVESAIAEKLQAIISIGFLNSRYKDYYDIFILSSKRSFSLFTLRNAITETFQNRHTPVPQQFPSFLSDFMNDPIHQNRWDAFLKKKKAMIQIPMKTVMNQIIVFTHPLFDESFTEDAIWIPETCSWQ